MRAAVLHATGEPMRLEDLRLDPPRASEVLVRVQAADVCHSDLHYLTTLRPEGRGSRPSQAGVPVSQPIAPGRTRSV